METKSPEEFHVQGCRPVKACFAGADQSAGRESVFDDSDIKSGHLGQQ